MLAGKVSSAQVWCSLNFFFSSQDLMQGDIGRVDNAINQWILPEGTTALVVATQGTPAVATMHPTQVADLTPGMTREQVVAAMGDPLQEGKLKSVERNASALVPVKITSDPPGADVLLDGKFVSSTPAVLRIAGGDYKV